LPDFKWLNVNQPLAEDSLSAVTTKGEGKGMGKRSNEEKLSDRLPHWLPVFLLVAAVMLVSIYAIVFHALPWTSDPSAWGSFGDYMGGLLNPFVSTLTLIIAIKVWAQQRAELKATKDALEDQATTAKANRCEQRFFDLMQVYQQTLDSFYWVVSKNNSAIPQQGKSAMQELLSSPDCLNGIGGIYQHFGSRNPSEKSWRSSLENRYKSTAIALSFSHYLRVVFQVLHDADLILEENADRYIRLFRAQLSQTELVLLGLYLWLDEDGQKKHNIAGKFGLLEDLPTSDLRDLLEKELPPEIFKH
jgi:hypothetical protein